MADMNKLLRLAAEMLAMPEDNVHLSPPRQRRRKVSFADDVNDNDHSESSRKPFVSQVPAKKNLAILKRDDHRSREGVIVDQDNETVGSALSKDEDDQEKISKLSDREHRIVLDACEETDKNFTRTLKERECEEGRSSQKVHDHSKAKRTGALAELVVQRKNAAKRRSGLQCSSADKIELPTANVSNSNLPLTNEEETSGDEMKLCSDEDLKLPEPPTLHEIMAITVSRSKLAKWLMEPYFDELIPGCFVRVFTGKGEAEAPVYMLCEVLNVDAADCNPQYEFESKSTHKYLNAVWGNGTPVRLEMTRASNSPPRKVELEQWVMQVKHNGGHMPSKQKLLEKKQAFQKVNSFVYSAAVVKQTVEEEQSSVWKPSYIAAEKARIKRELELASDFDEIELKRIQARLQELEAVHKSSRGSRMKVLVGEELNKKNLLANLNNSSRRSM